MDVLKPLRLVNRVVKQWRKEQMGRYLRSCGALSASRRRAIG